MLPALAVSYNLRDQNSSKDDSTYLRIFDDSPELFHNGLVDVSLLADHCVVLVVGVVGIPAV